MKGTEMGTPNREPREYSGNMRQRARGSKGREGAKGEMEPAMSGVTSTRQQLAHVARGRRSQAINVGSGSAYLEDQASKDSTKQALQSKK